MFEFVEDGRYLVRDLIQVPIEEMKRSPEAARIFLTFDDGEIESTSRECIHARFCWEMYSIFPHIKVSKEHHLVHYRRRITPSTTGEILNKIKWDCTFLCHEHGIFPGLPESCEKIYAITDMIDAFYHELRHFSVFVSSMDFIELQHHPEISKAMQELREKPAVVPADIPRTYNVIKNVIDHDKAYRRNTFVMTTKSESTKIGQLNKCIGPNGYIADVDSRIFRKPVIDSFVTGITNIRDLIMESRTAAMSIFYQKHAMQQSEYLTRMLQLAAECVFRVRPGDCGSKRYLEVPIRKRSDLKDMTGIWYLDPDTETEKPITAKSFHLLKRVVRVRSVLHCQLNDRFGVCAKCYGQLADSLFETDNIGHIAATVLQQFITQMILSNKHLVASASGESVQLTAEDQEYIRPKGEDGSTFYINPALKGKRFTISFSGENAGRLQDIMYIEDLMTSSPSRLTQLDDLFFRVYRGDELVREYPLCVSTKSQKAFFTIPMLEYIRTHGWKIDQGSNYEISMDHWDFADPLIELPMVQYSTPAHMMAVKEMLTTDSSKENKHTISRYPNPSAALLAFHDLVKLRLNVNFSHLQTIILTYLCTDPANFDFRIPAIKSTGKLMPYKDIMITRDFALAMSYEKHFDTFRSMRTYVIKQRHPHPHSNALRG